jgi:hypothetical protein
MTRKTVLLELNEVNFEYVRRYAEWGHTPRLKKLIDQHGISETTSEQHYHHVEPWIQWVTAHTGLDFAEHSVMRLGDIVKQDLPQIWERIEQSGLQVGAISPMNAKNRTRRAAFFLPDPWTPTPITGGVVARRLHQAMAQIVNDNASSRVKLSSALWLIAGIVRFAKARNYGRYARLALRRRPWCNAMFLDLLLADIFVCELQRTGPDFASIFLNGAAHVQHHYMFNSRVYEGEQRNPDWYIGRDDDPVGEVYELYDRIVGQIQDAFPSVRLIIATGLHQDPHPVLTYYWRLKAHAAFLRKIGVPFRNVETRMSRDFVIRCSSPSEARRAEEVLASARSLDGRALFEIENQGRDLFVMLTWPDDILAGFEFTVGETRYKGLREDVVFVAIKNGEHNQIGYFIDAGSERACAPASFPLREVPLRICDALGIQWPRAESRSAV